MPTKQEKLLNSDSEKASELQKTLPFPKLSTSVAYYKRKLYVYNLRVQSLNFKTGFMYVWDETEGGGNSQDVASCVAKHLKENVGYSSSGNLAL